jgi:hypothetical protein
MKGNAVPRLTAIARLEHQLHCYRRHVRNQDRGKEVKGNEQVRILSTALPCRFYGVHK